MKFCQVDDENVQVCIILMEEYIFLRQLRKFFFYSIVDTVQKIDIILSINRFAISKVIEVNYAEYIPKH